MLTRAVFSPASSSFTGEEKKVIIQSAWKSLFPSDPEWSAFMSKEHYIQGAEDFQGFFFFPFSFFKVRTERQKR